MATLKYTVFALAVVAFTGCRAVVVKTCGENPNDGVIKINSLNIDPSPIQVPGSVSVSLNVDVTKSIDKNVRADVTIMRKLWPIWITIPCYNNIGSCTYTDVCSFLGSLRNGCPSILTDMNITCACPVAAGKYTLISHSVRIDNNILGVRLPMLAGQYQAKVRLTDSNTQREIACFDVEAKLTNPPSPGLTGLFSRLFG